MAIYKVRNNETGMFLTKDSLKESGNGTVLRSMLAARNLKEYAINYFTRQNMITSEASIEIVKFEIIESGIVS